MDVQRRDEIGEMLSAYLDGELTPTESVEVERLLDQDDEVRALMVELRQAADSVRELQHGVAPPEILSEIQQRVERQELLGPPDQPVALSRHQKRPLRSILATAAALIITVGGGLWAMQLLSNRSESQHATGPRSGRSQAPDAQRQFEQIPARDALFKDRSTVGRRIVSDDSQPSATAVIQDRSAPAPVETQTVLEERMDRNNRGVSSVDKKELDSDALDRLTGLGYVSGGDAREEKGVSRSLRDERKFSKSQLPVAPPPAPEALKASPKQKEQVEATANKRQPLDPTATLEQKLEQGIAVAAVLDHRFANEPIQLEIELADARRARPFAQRLQAVVESRAHRQPDVTGAFVGGWRMREADNIAAEGNSQELGLDDAVWIEGEPDHNYETGQPDEIQYLARVDARTFAAILSAANDAGETVVDRKLYVGRMRAETDADIRRLAEMTLGRSLDAPPGRFARENRRLSADHDPLPAIDLANMLRKIGVAPPGIDGPTQQAAQTKNESSAESSDDARLADRADATPTPSSKLQDEPRRRNQGQPELPEQEKTDSPLPADESELAPDQKADMQKEAGSKFGDQAEPLYTIVIRLIPRPVSATPGPTATPTPTPQANVKPAATRATNDDVMLEMQSDSPDSPKDEQR